MSKIVNNLKSVSIRSEI